MKNLCLILVAITATFPTLQAQSAAPHAEAKTAADTTVRSLVDSWNRADGIAYGKTTGRTLNSSVPLARSSTDAQPSPTAY